MANIADAITIKTPIVQVAGGQKYLVHPETTADQVLMGDGSDVKTRLLTMERTIAGTANMRIVDTIADRDALTGLIPGDQCWVVDATADATVETGGAKYLYMLDNTWLKVGELESLDVVLSWDKIQNKPTSTVADIDLAVAKQHTHTNIETLSHLSDDDAGNLLFKGKRISDGKVWSCLVDSLDAIPASLADGGLVLLRTVTQEEGDGDDAGGAGNDGDGNEGEIGG